MEHISEDFLRDPVRFFDLRQLLSESIAVYRLQARVLSVFLTVSPGSPDKKPRDFGHLQVPETIEWE